MPPDLRQSSQQGDTNMHTDIAWLDLLDVGGSLLAALVTLVISWQVHNYTRRKDKASVIQAMWEQQQEWNLTAAGSPAHARAIEQMTYGKRPRNEEEWFALVACVFFFLNRINHVWDAAKQGIMNPAEFEEEVTPNLRLLAGQKTLVSKLLSERGYDPEFNRKVREMLEPIEPTGSVDIFGISRFRTDRP